MKNTKLIGRGLVLIVALTCMAAASMAQSSRGGIFQKADSLMATADEVDAALLSPTNYSAAQTAYKQAADQADRGRGDRAQKELTKAEAALAKAIEASKLGKVQFSTTLKQRDLAVAAEAAKFEPELWVRAEDQFRSAASKLESGNVNSAADKGRKATAYYSEAELAAIKTAIVGQARVLIAADDKDKVAKDAPDSLNRAKALVAEAEASLTKRRYDTSGPIALAAEAEYEARHAAYLAEQVRRIDDKKITKEQMLIAWEKPLQEIASALDVTTDMSAGFSKSASASVNMVQSLQSDAAAKTARVAELEAQLGGLQAELGGKEQLVAETKRLQQELAQVESLFSPSQARVVREGDDMVVRLVGLSFPSGQSIIETRYFALLKKVQEAIQVFPDSPIVIEGHTDSVGSDAVNMKLSQDRANSVREYLIANLGLPESRITSIGYGKTRPIASNESEAGRAQNRRIDVVIKKARASRL